MIGGYRLGERAESRRLLVGLRLQNINVPVLGVCVRRAAAAQWERGFRHCGLLAEMLGGVKINESDVWVDDSALAPGYGAASERVWRDIGMLAARAGLLTDPVYSGKVFRACLNWRGAATLMHFAISPLVHTGGLPALFAYREKVARAHIME